MISFLNALTFELDYLVNYWRQRKNEQNHFVGNFVLFIFCYKTFFGRTHRFRDINEKLKKVTYFVIQRRGLTSKSSGLLIQSLLDLPEQAYKVSELSDCFPPFAQIEPSLTGLLLILQFLLILTIVTRFTLLCRNHL